MNTLPDIILFLSDDHAAWATGCLGNLQVHTPNIDRLASEGVVMENAFTPTPVCSPARACVFSGRTASQHGVHDYIGTTGDSDVDKNWVSQEVLLPQILQAHGYATALVGKWHLGQERLSKQGFDFCFTLGPEYPINHFGPRVFYKLDTSVPTQGYLARTITDAAVECIRNRDKDKPLFLVIGHYATHSPWEGHPERLVDRYRKRNLHHGLPGTHYPFGCQINESLNATREDPQESLCQYYAGVTEIDESVGTILDELDAQNMVDNTLVTYTSDHGLNCGHHGLWGKGNATWPLNMLEQSIRIPLILRYPNKLFAKQRRTEFVDHTDLFNTILDLAGVHEAPSESKKRNSPGTSFSSLVMNQPQTRQWRTVQFCEYGPVRMARSNRYKLVLYPDPSHNLLFDLETDPFEEQNRFQDPQLAGIRDVLASAVSRHFTCHREERHDGSIPENLPRCNPHPAWMPHTYAN